MRAWHIQIPDVFTVHHKYDNIGWTAILFPLLTKSSLNIFSLKLTCPPRSHNLNCTLPFLMLRWLNPMVGMVSSSNYPVAMVLTSVVLPAFWRPTSDISSSLVNNLDLIQSRIPSRNDFYLLWSINFKN